MHDYIQELRFIIQLSSYLDIDDSMNCYMYDYSLTWNSTENQQTKAMSCCKFWIYWVLFVNFVISPTQ